MTSPAPTTIRYYCIPRWTPGQKIFLPADCMPNVASPALLDWPAPTPLGGVIERTQLWSDKLAQPSQTMQFDANASPLARARLEEGYRVVDEALRRTAPASRPAGSAPLPPPAPATALIAGPILAARVDLDDNSPELARARPPPSAAELLPAQSPLVEDAKGARRCAPHGLARSAQATGRCVPERPWLFRRRAPACGWSISPACSRRWPRRPTAKPPSAPPATPRATRPHDRCAHRRRQQRRRHAHQHRSTGDETKIRRASPGGCELQPPAAEPVRSTQPPPTRPPTEADLKRRHLLDVVAPRAARQQPDRHRHRRPR